MFDRRVTLAVLVGELLEPPQLVAVPAYRAGAGVAIQLQPLEVFLDGLGEGNGALASGHLPILALNFPKS